MLQEFLLLLLLNHRRLIQNFLLVETCEENLRLRRHPAAVRIQAKLLHRIKRTRRRAKLLLNPVRRRRQERCEQGRRHADPFRQVIENRRKTVLFCRILRKIPGLRLINIFVEALVDGEDLCQGIRHAELLHILLHLRIGTGADFPEFRIDRLVRMAVLHRTIKILVAHGDRALHQIAQHIREVGIGPLDHQFPRDDTVILIRHFVQHKIPDRIESEDIHQIIRVDDIPLGLAHLLAALQQPRVSEHLLRQRLSQRHQEDGPVNRVEPDDIFSDQMKIRRPLLMIETAAVPIRVIADAGDVVAERVKPDIHDMPRIEIHGDAPLEARSRHAQILQAGKQKIVHHLIPAGNRLDEFRVGVDIIDELRRILAHPKEIGLLLLGMHLPAANRAPPVFGQLRLRVEGFALRAVQAVVMSLIDISLLIKAAEDFLDLNHVVLIRGADEPVITRPHQVPDAADLRAGSVHKFLRTHTLLDGTLLDLLPVLVGPRLKPDIIAVRTLISCDGVCQNSLVGVADVRLA